MKRIIVLLMLICLMWSLAGCVAPPEFGEAPGASGNTSENAPLQRPDKDSPNSPDFNQDSPAGAGNPSDGLRKGIEMPFVSDVNVDAFSELFGETIVDVKNVLPLWIIEAYNINVFQKNDGSNVYIMYDGEIFPLYPYALSGTGGIAHICVEDIDCDGFAELYLSSSAGKSRVYSIVYGFDTKTKALIESAANNQEINYFRYVDGVLMANDFLSIVKRETQLELAKAEYAVFGESFEAVVKIDAKQINFPAMFVDRLGFSYVSLILEVKTKYIGESYLHEGSSTLFGAVPSMENEERTYEPILWVTDDLVRITIEQGREFEDRFSIEFFDLPEVGAYDLVFSYRDERVVFKDAVWVTALE